MAASIAHRRLGQPLGQSLFGKTVLVVGFGSIAKELIARLRAFGVTITALRRRPRWGAGAGDPAAAAAEAALSDRGCWPADTARLAAGADLVVVTCHQDERSRGMVNAEFLRACKPGVRIVNVARGEHAGLPTRRRSRPPRAPCHLMWRQSLHTPSPPLPPKGGLLDYGAVRKGLESGRIGGLGLDVQWEEPVDPGGWGALVPCWCCGRLRPLALLWAWRGPRGWRTRRRGPRPPTPPPSCDMRR